MLDVLGNPSGVIPARQERRAHSRQPRPRRCPIQGDATLMFWLSTRAQNRQVDPAKSEAYPAVQITDPNLRSRIASCRMGARASDAQRIGKPGMRSWLRRQAHSIGIHQVQEGIITRRRCSGLDHR